MSLLSLEFVAGAVLESSPVAGALLSVLPVAGAVLVSSACAKETNWVVDKTVSNAAIAIDDFFIACLPWKIKNQMSFLKKQLKHSMKIVFVSIPCIIFIIRCLAECSNAQKNILVSSLCKQWLD